MKKIIAVLVVLFILGTGVPSYFWITTDDALSAARLEKETLSRKLEASEKMLAVTKMGLNTTQDILMATQAERDLANENAKQTLAAAEQKIEGAQEELNLVRQEKDLVRQEKESERIGKESALWKLGLLSKKDPTLLLEPPIEKGRMESGYLLSILQQKFPNTSIYYRGGGVRLFSKEQWEEFIAADDLNTVMYSPERFNCTEYSIILSGRARRWARGSAFGTIIVVRPGLEAPGTSHYQNFFVDEKGEVWLVEPQNDNVFAPPANWQYLLILQ